MGALGHEDLGGRRLRRGSDGDRLDGLVVDRDGRDRSHLLGLLRLPRAEHREDAEGEREQREADQDGHDPDLRDVDDGPVCERVAPEHGEPCHDAGDEADGGRDEEVPSGDPGGVLEAVVQLVVVVPEKGHFSVDPVDLGLEGRDLGDLGPHGQQGGVDALELARVHRRQVRVVRVRVDVLEDLVDLVDLVLELRVVAELPDDALQLGDALTVDLGGAGLRGLVGRRLGGRGARGRRRGRCAAGASGLVAG